ncbi:MAG: flavodoxin-dependent (E)-4-hydroxy-3-methylbut-2-enyl-diphosphate synthase [Agathobaculum sp.]|uniref:flavodoxin-dependent (E)-4-hydroxy-3-methylbut-2-enyl-diphosphate synthase n=1 Tax=Agathobaculum sp. TaxID=2048138 RepID=UPI002A818D9A|nr:flavodoxin-dependent (E)-4-hydroxy-3-methylbut-2-enyl-diphosphate synthase [Agathobaculum sp.]MDY3712491.1 flavodoxin-dependent (E)-4-hydroxy-3-methylbut-2-enyl-diphosphate synthase [Agathobaculum sp.]
MKQTKQIKIRDVLVGGGAPVAVQSMTNTDTRDAKATLAQIGALAEAGCHIVRCAVPDMQATEAMKEICAKSPLPVVADIHFDYRLALASMEAGADKIRLNPGNIGGAERVQAVVKLAKERGVPIRIGVNSGSVEKHILEKFGAPTPEAMVESALYHVGLLNDCGFDDICISIKSSSVPSTMRAYLLAHERTDYPLHLGVTEAGTEYMGTVKSAAGIGGLLALGVGDTIRVSLTDDPVKEIYAANAILRAVGRAEDGINVVSCPTCGRTRIDLIDIAKQVEQHCAAIHGKKLKVAVMGCAVNGPGEAREADLGIAGGDGVGLIFRKGEIVKKVPQERLVDELMAMIGEA